ncbi:DUF4238 domain-containing protein [Acidiluteibacter ferrifornacis]|uniref:DUF4238 domain-containing protein n=1 Tax=Acidiluteibacter ferrifornacis TaxID=2692424 RepID=A0A6N9NSR1_9FLAO|nr:DUF4238 domain-containing protein [Acidiluteibacter ferrifornacis]NBG67415.1 DUF4238 domain-containing protein [Acidiluteibacter ferrifornacis]
MKKERQHFIPKVYLKNFAFDKQDDKAFVSAYNKIDEEYKESISIKDICVDTDFYTLKNLEGDEKYAVENFFDNYIEKKYSSVYKLLVEDKIEVITPKQRFEILYTILSLHFRTPKRLNQLVSSSVNMIESLKENPDVNTINFMGLNLDLEGKKLKEIKNEIREHNRVDFIKTQFVLFHQFVDLRKSDAINIIQLTGEDEYITSDNPVLIRNTKTELEQLFDPSNSIYVPLDPKHSLFIAPKMDDVILNRVFYQKDNFFAHGVSNHNEFHNAERWIIGTKVGVKRFLDKKPEYDQPASENHPIVKKAKETSEAAEKLLELLEKDPSNNNSELLTFLSELTNSPLYKDNQALIDMVERLEPFKFKY